LEFSACLPPGMQVAILVSNRSLLIAVRMAVAPIPVVSLHSGVLPTVLTISSVLCDQVIPIRAVFVVVPVMVVMVVPIVDSHPDAAVLGSGTGQDSGWCSNDSSQK
jgi:hypothetical protein